MPPRTLETTLQLMQIYSASDLHLRVGEYPFLRINGDLVRSEDVGLLCKERLEELVRDLINEEQRTILERQGAVDFALEMRPPNGSGTPLTNAGNIRFRANIFKHSTGFGIVLRLIPSVVPTLNSLGLPPVLGELCKLNHGLVLITGPTGSGKTTTLAALIDQINLQRKAHIITIEDPIEFIHQSKRSLVTQREIGAQVPAFSTALRSALREDPDIILVGEMRDQETMQLALTAAETGHLVLSTLHTSSAARTVDRIIDSFPAAQQPQVRTMLAESLSAVVAQTLVKARSAGRVAAVEIMLATPAIRSLIRESKVHQLANVIQTSAGSGMQTMEMHLQELRRRGVVG